MAVKIRHTKKLQSDCTIMKFFSAMQCLRLIVIHLKGVKKRFGVEKKGFCFFLFFGKCFKAVV